MKFLGKYSNGWGHLLVTLAALIFCLILLLTTEDVTIKGLAVSVVTLLVGYWFGSGRIAERKHEQDQQEKEKKDDGTP